MQSEEQTDFSSKEHEVLERVAQALGLSVVETVSFLAKKGLEKRANRPVKVPARVFQFRAKRAA